MQEIIVYRNPLEAAMWHTVMSGEFFPVIAGVVVFFAVFLPLNHFLSQRFGSWGKTGKQVSYFSLGVGAVLGITTVRLMWI